MTWEEAGKAIEALSERGLFVYTCTYHAGGGPHFTRVTIHQQAYSELTEVLNEEPLVYVTASSFPEAVALAIEELEQT